MGKGTVSASSTSAATGDVSEAIALADPQGALDQFQQAAQVIEQQYPGALSAFQNYVTQGTAGQMDLQQQALASTLPVSSAATAAVGELRGFLGLPAISPTAGLSQNLNQAVNQLRMSGDPAAQDMAAELSGIAGQLQQAENIEDPQQREAMKQELMGQMDSFSQQAQSTLGDQFNQIAPTLQNVSNQFDVGYGAQQKDAWSPDVVQAKLEATPGYQFRFNQGLKALDRSAAAKGNLMSGQTLAAAQEFGQNMASQEYQNQINRLQQTAGMSAPSVGQQAGLLAGMGQTLGQTGQQLGTTAGNVLQGIAGAGQQAYNLGGQGMLSSNALQSQLQQQGLLQNQQNQQQSSNLNAQLQQQANLANQSMDTKTLGLLTGLLNK